MIESDFSKIIQNYFNSFKKIAVVPIETFDDDGVPDLYIGLEFVPAWIELKVVKNIYEPARFRKSQVHFHLGMYKKNHPTYIWILDNEKQRVYQFKGEDIALLCLRCIYEAKEKVIFETDLENYIKIKHKAKAPGLFEL